MTGHAKDDVGIMIISRRRSSKLPLLEACLLLEWGEEGLAQVNHSLYSLLHAQGPRQFQRMEFISLYMRMLHLTKGTIKAVLQ